MTKRSKSSERWLRRQQRDPYTKQARAEGQISRAHFKLKELDERFGLIKKGQTVLELGAAPGGWTHYIEERLGATGQLVACDSRPVTHGPGTRFVQGDYGAEDIDNIIDNILADRGLDLVLSDMAPNLSGIKAADQARAIGLAELAEDAAHRWLKPGGNLLVKLFQGEGVDAWLSGLRRDFSKARLVKPRASRSQSREVYAIALEFNGVSSE